MVLGLGSWFIFSMALVVLLAFAPVTSHLAWRSSFSFTAIFFVGVFVFLCGYLPSTLFLSLIGGAGSTSFSLSGLPWVGVPYV